MKKIFGSVVLFFMICNSANASCLPTLIDNPIELNLVMKISEFDYNHTEKDFVEFYVSNPKALDSSKIEVILDGKNIWKNELLTNYNVAYADLVSTTEQIFLKYDGIYVDAVCWSNGTIPQSEVLDMELFDDLNFGECLDYGKLSKSQSYSKINLLGNNIQENWLITFNNTLGFENNFVYEDIYVEILLTSGSLYGVESTKVNFDSKIDNPDGLKLSYNWLLDGVSFSDKANPSEMKIEGKGIYEIKLVVTDEYGKTYMDKTIVIIESKQVSKQPEGNSENSGSSNDSDSNETSPNQTLDDLQDFQLENDYEKYKGLVISALLPNPEGSDTGKEWIEIFNNSSFDVNLKGWVLDDMEGQSKPYTFTTDRWVKQGEKVQIFDSESKLVLNNDTDQARLFSPDGKLFDMIEYKNPKSGEVIYAKTVSEIVGEDEGIDEASNSEKTVAATTKNTNVAKAKNTSDSSAIKWDGKWIKVTEVFPNPEGNDSGKEWIEIYNDNNSVVDLTGWIVKINTKNVKLDGNIDAKTYKTISINGISNASAKFGLISPDGKEIQSFSYDKSVEGYSFALIGENFEWTKFASPNSENPIIQKSNGVIQELNLPEFEIIINDTRMFFDEKLKPKVKVGDEVAYSFVNFEGQVYLVSIEANSDLATIMGKVQEENQKLNNTFGWLFWLQICMAMLVVITVLIFRKPILDFAKTKLQEI